MRLMMKFTIPVERGNEAVKAGTIGKAIEDLVKAALSRRCHAKKELGSLARRRARPKS